ncbi:MucR family transcriptional regulator [Novosphingobium sp. Gsoil 351]|uniref:MucR family transcriptional regulator n=1 Tax=Novosphingobium sp. Gsoil 351 TaxID=2675225 RepID=UPI0012B44C49|nr:MucR family transcriptional regulator [Novosphingobium sp. Gsoil 351]QGN55554.1 transcriptional regulator [Novosphingobium sp. Gsoil 351]
MAETNNEMHETLITLTSDIVAAHVGSNNVGVGELPQLITNVYAALSGLGASAPVAEAPPEPAVSVRSSIKNDYIVCLEDGKKLKMLKRHLMTHYSMTPDQYRTRWGLSADYPMVAPAYAEKRRELAKKIGLGRKPGTKMTPKAAAPAKVPGKRGRPRKDASAA